MAIKSKKTSTTNKNVNSGKVTWTFSPDLTSHRPSDPTCRDYFFSIHVTSGKASYIDHFIIETHYIHNGADFPQSQSSVSLSSTGDATVNVSVPDGYEIVYSKAKAVGKTYTTGSGKNKQTKTRSVDTSWHQTAAGGPGLSSDATSAPNAPSLTTTSDGLQATVTGVGNIDNVSRIIFEFVKNNSESVGTITANIAYGQAIAIFTAIEPGCSYKARAAKLTDNGYTGTWSGLSSGSLSGPGGIDEVSVCAYSESQARLTYSEAKGADGYEVEWASNQDYFDVNPTEVSSQSYGNITMPIVSGLDNTGGKRWYFRVRGTNNGGSGKGGWSSIVSCLMATVPTAPTCWTYSTVAKVGETVTLNWVHNSADGSTQTGANLLVYRNGVLILNYITDSSQSTYPFTTSGYSDQDKITWQVRTRGAHSDYGPFSELKLFTIYAQPGVTMTGLPTRLTSFPLTLNCNATPSTQKLLSYSVVITSNSDYDTLDEYGMLSSVPAGGIVYEAYEDNVSGNSFTISLTPGDISLENTFGYTVTVRVYMDSGLDGQTTGSFSVQYAQLNLYPDASYTFDFDTLSCCIEPSCYYISGNNHVYTNAVYYGIYRRNYDGTFTPIGKDIDGAKVGAVLDPHPSLNYARYRIVVKSKATGQITFDDVALIAVNHSSVVIQWNEQWTNYGENTFVSASQVPKSGSRIDIPYNIDVTAQSNPDVTLVKYIGRSHPVSYYGTQKGETGSWKFEVPKDDVDTIYGLRRLANYSGDCYVREPSGIGYWAHVKVSHTITHNKKVVPFTLSLERVDGGM